MSTTITYNGSTIAQVNNETKTLLTSGKWLTGNIILTDVSEGGGGITHENIVPTTTISATAGDWARLTSGTTPSLIEGEYYAYTINGVERVATATLTGNNIYLSDIEFDWSGDGFAVAYDTVYGGIWFNASATSGEYTVKVDKITFSDSGSGSSSATLITKTITENGTYSASSDNADGYSQVVVNVSSGGGGIPRTVIAVQQTVTASEYFTALSASEGLTEGNVYAYTVDGTEYVGMAVTNSGMLYVNSGFTYAIGAYSGNLYLVTQSTGQHTVKVEKLDLSGGGGGGSSATLVTKSITANGTYSAEDDNADGYSEVTVNVPSAAVKNVQTEQSTTRRNNTSLGSIISLTCSKAGTYDVYWTCARTNTSQTWGSQLYINDTAYGTENTTWSNNVQNNHLTDVEIPANATVAVYGRSRSGYYIHAPQLTIVQTA